MEVPLNWLAVILAALSNMVLGFLWYGPLFGKQWMHLMGFTRESMSDAKKKGMGQSYALMTLGAFLMAYVFAHSYTFAATYLNLHGVGSGLQGAFYNWLGFIAPVTISAVIWDGKPWKLWCINAGYYLAALMIMGVIIGGMMP